MRACAKLIGVSPSSAFRHYADKRSLMTAFATRALLQLSAAMATAKAETIESGSDPFLSVSLAYVRFALEKPAFFRAMWSEETLYTADVDYVAATASMSEHLQGGFANTLADSDASALSSQELLAWSAVHGLAALYVDGPVGKEESTARRLVRAEEMIKVLAPALGMAPGAVPAQDS